MNRKPFFVRSLAFILVASATGIGTVQAHHPDRKNQPVTPVIDVIGPLGNRLPPSHRRRYNRPSYLSGYLVYKIAPSSQEAMSWHRAVHADAYKEPKKHCRLEQHYFYPKPWEVLTVGPRRSRLEPVQVASPVVELEAQTLETGRAIEQLMEEPLQREIPDVKVDVPELPSPSDLKDAPAEAGILELIPPRDR